MKTTDFDWGITEVDYLSNDHDKVKEYNIKYQSNGNQLLFLSADDIDHIKSGGVLMVEVNEHEYHVIVAWGEA